MSYGYNDSTGTSYGGGAGGGLGGFLSSLSGADNVASDHAGPSGDKDLFSNVLSLVGNKHDQLKDEDVDEDDMVNTHDSYYGSGKGSGGSATSGGMGKAAALEAMKLFNRGQTSGSSGGDSKGAFIGLAMGQAAKLFGESSSDFYPLRCVCVPQDEYDQHANGCLHCRPTVLGRQRLLERVQAERDPAGRRGGIEDVPQV